MHEIDEVCTHKATANLAGQAGWAMSGVVPDRVAAPPPPLMVSTPSVSNIWPGQVVNTSDVSAIRRHH